MLCCSYLKTCDPHENVRKTLGTNHLDSSRPLVRCSALVLTGVFKFLFPENGNNTTVNIFLLLSSKMHTKAVLNCDSHDATLVIQSPLQQKEKEKERNLMPIPGVQCMIYTFRSLCERPGMKKARTPSSKREKFKVINKRHCFGGIYS
jgi:hypothetical protein